MRSALCSAFAPPEQPYLVAARQMQALSFMVHIPLVCFGIAFPATTAETIIEAVRSVS